MFFKMAYFEDSTFALFNTVLNSIYMLNFHTYDEVNELGNVERVSMYTNTNIIILII